MEHVFLKKIINIYIYIFLQFYSASCSSSCWAQTCVLRDMWPADVAQWVLARPDEFGKTEGVTEEEGKEGNEQRLDRKQSSSQNLMYDLRKDPVQNVTRTTLEESRVQVHLDVIL